MIAKHNKQIWNWQKIPKIKIQIDFLDPIDRQGGKYGKMFKHSIRLKLNWNIFLTVFKRFI